MKSHIPSQAAGVRAIDGLIERFGCLPAAPDGPRIEKFDPGELAAAMFQEISRCDDYGWPKVTLHMDRVDALLLAKFLKEHAGSGVGQ